jgi:uncharacterized protein (DUF3084 family)
MVQNHVILVLFVGGLIGWTGLIIMVYFIFNYNIKEIEMIDEIQQELQILKEEIKKLK